MEKQEMEDALNRAGMYQIVCDLFPAAAGVIAEILLRAEEAEKELAQVREWYRLTSEAFVSSQAAMRVVEQQWHDMADRLKAVGVDPIQVIYKSTTDRHRQPGGLLSKEALSELRGAGMMASSDGKETVPVDIRTLAAMLNALEIKEEQ